MLDADFFGLFLTFIPTDWLQAGHDLITSATSWVFEKYKDAPALVLGVALALALPALALSSPLVRLMLHRNDSDQNQHVTTFRTRPASVWQQQAWLESQSSRRLNYPVTRDLMRIGRAADNDVCLEKPGIHRYHAILERTPEAEFIISYLGDPAHDGLLIDGRPAWRERLRGGEVIEIGAVKLRFALSAGESARP